MKLRSSHGPFSSEDVSKYFDIAVAAEGGAVIVSDLKKLEAPEFTSWKKFLTGSHYPFDTPMTIYPHAHAFNGGIFGGKRYYYGYPPACTQPENPWVAATAPTVWEETLSWRPRYLESFRQRGGRLRESRGNTDDVTSEESLAMIEQACYSKERQGKMPPEKAMEAVQKIVQKAAFLERTEEKLNEGIRSLERLREAYAPMAFFGYASGGLRVFHIQCGLLRAFNADRYAGAQRNPGCTSASGLP